MLAIRTPSADLSPSQAEAVRVLGVYTAGRFNPQNLTGRDNALLRAQLMTILAGKRVPQSQSGVNALVAAFYAFANPAGNCPAAQRESFATWCKALHAPAAPTPETAEDPERWDGLS